MTPIDITIAILVVAGFLCLGYWVQRHRESVARLARLEDIVHMATTREASASVPRTVDE